MVVAGEKLAELSASACGNREQAGMYGNWLVKYLRDVPPPKKNKKNQENVGILPKLGTHPLPPVWEPHVCKEKKWFVGLNGLFCILGPLEHFWFSQKCYFLVGIMVDRSGNGWPTPPHPPCEKNPTVPFSLNFLQKKHSVTQNKINLKWSNWSDNTSSLL